MSHAFDSCRSIAPGVQRGRIEARFQRTRSPRATSLAVIRRPMFPVAPVTSTFIDAILGTPSVAPLVARRRSPSRSAARQDGRSGPVLAEPDDPKAGARSARVGAFERSFDSTASAGARDVLKFCTGAQVMQQAAACRWSLQHPSGVFISRGGGPIAARPWGRAQVRLRNTTRCCHGKVPTVRSQSQTNA